MTSGKNPKSDEDNYDGPWAAGPVKCDVCGYKWVAVRPSEIDKIECSNCNQMVSYEEDPEGDL